MMADTKKITLTPLSPVKLDKTNMRLLAALDVNGRLPLSQVAKKIGVSRENTHYRFKQLQTDGVISSFELFVNNFVLGYKCYCLLLNLENLIDATREEMVAELKSNKNIDVKTYILSIWDLELTIWVKDDSEFYSFYDAFIKKHNNFIVDKRLFVVTRVHAFSHAYLHDMMHTVIVGPSKCVVIDEIDEKLLNILERDPRVELVAIAARLKIAATTVAYRIRKLIRSKVILGCMPRLDLNRIGYTQYRIEILLNNPAQRSDVVSFLSAHAHILRIYELIGSMDLAFEGDFSSAIQVDDFLQQLKNKVPMIRNFDVRTIVKQ